MYAKMTGGLFLNYLNNICVGVYVGVLPPHIPLTAYLPVVCRVAAYESICICIVVFI